MPKAVLKVAGKTLAADGPYVTASHTPAPNTLQLLEVVARTNISVDTVQPTVTGNGLTWVLVNDIVYDTASASRKRLSVFRAMGSAPSTGATTITYSGQVQTDAFWTITEFSDVRVVAADNGAASVVQSVTGKDEVTTDTTMSVTLAAFEVGTRNAAYGACSNDFNIPNQTKGAGFAELSSDGDNTTGLGLLAEWSEGGQTLVAFNFNAGGESGIVALEIRAPLITRGPSASPKQVGDTLFLDVLASGSSGLTYQWQDNSGGSLADMAGQTGQNLTVTGLTIGMNGRQYAVKVTDAIGTETSATFVLAVSDRVDANYFLRDVPSDANSSDVRLYDRPDVAGATGPVGTLSVTLDAVTLAATAQALVQGTLTTTLGAVTLSAAGQTLVQGTLAKTLGDTTLSAAGQTLVQGTLATTLGGTTLSATGTALVQGTLTKTLDDVTLSATGTVTTASINGDLSVTLGDVTLAGAGQALVQGSLDKTLLGVTLAATGATLVQGTLTTTLDDVTLSATGTVGSVTINGDLAVTLGDATLAASGQTIVAGTLTKTLDNATLAAAGQAFVQGTLSTTLADTTLTGAGATLVQGTLSVTLGATTLAATGSNVSDPGGGGTPVTRVKQQILTVGRLMS